MIDLKNVKQTDPVKKQEVKGLDQLEHTPMDPPSAYENPVTDKIEPASYHQVITQLMDEHKVALQQLESFEAALTQFKSNGYKLDVEINKRFSDFFKYYDDKLLKHNEKEDKVLFPLLHQRLIESGEHSVSENPMTAIDIMEDDHVKFIQLGTITFNMLGVATRLQDINSRNFVFDVAFENGRELIELLKLHIYREDQTLFPLAQKLITDQEFEPMIKALKKYN